MTEGKRRTRDVVLAKVANEERWAHTMRMQRLGFEQMQDLSALPVAQGGLGYLVPARTLKKRADAYFAEMRATLQDDRATRAERQSYEIDERARVARADLIRAYEAGDVKAVEAADRRLAAAMRDERDLFGLNAATKIEAEVTTHDGVLEELNDALARMGRPPILAENYPRH